MNLVAGFLFMKNGLHGNGYNFMIIVPSPKALYQYSLQITMNFIHLIFK